MDASAYFGPGGSQFEGNPLPSSLSRLGSSFFRTCIIIIIIFIIIIIIRERW
jgi:ascorbate-specific PTS system EIIC-type component UlaA